MDVLNHGSGELGLFRLMMFAGAANVEIRNSKLGNGGADGVCKSQTSLPVHAWIQLVYLYTGTLGGTAGGVR